MQENVRKMWSEQELDQALGALNAEVPSGERALARARAELMTAAGDPESITARPITPKRHWGRWVAAIATVAAVIAAALVVQTVPFGNQAPVRTAAADVLNKAADKIGASDPVVKPGQYLYVETHAWNTAMASVIGGKTISYLNESVSQQWVPSDRTQEWLRHSYNTGKRTWIVGSEEDLKELGAGVDEPALPDAKAKCGDYFLNPGEQPCQRPGSWQRPTPEFLSSLPADPKQLYDRLRADTAGRGNDPDLEMVVYVADAIRSGLIPANVRANLYRALAMVPTLEISDQNANLDGRMGIGLGVDRAGEKHELIIDPATGQFIGERQTVTQDFEGMPKGTVRGYSSVSTGVVDKIGDKTVG